MSAPGAAVASHRADARGTASLSTGSLGRSAGSPGEGAAAPAGHAGTAGSGAAAAAARAGAPSGATTTVHASAPPEPPARPPSHAAASAVPAAPPAPAAPASPATPVAARGTVPPANPPADIPPNPNFLDTCSGAVPDTSAACQQATLAAIDAARAAEGLPGMVLPTDWSALTPAEQLFTVTNLERTARGLPALTGMDVALDQAAAAGAAQSADPAPPAGFAFRLWASNWGGALGSPLEADYLWMYDDGPGSANVDCPAAGAPGCWGHRDNVLAPLPCQDCVMGTAFDPTGWKGYPAWAELLVEAQGPTGVVFPWSDVTPYLPAWER